MSIVFGFGEQKEVEAGGGTEKERKKGGGMSEPRNEKSTMCGE